MRKGAGCGPGSPAPPEEAPQTASQPAYCWKSEDRGERGRRSGALLRSGQSHVPRGWGERGLERETAAEPGAWPRVTCPHRNATEFSVSFIC